MKLFLCYYIIQTHSEIIKKWHQISISDTKLAFCHQHCTVCHFVDGQV